MVPRSIVEHALRAGLAGIAICDHNAAANVPAVVEIGLEAGLGVIPGMEVTSAEEIHLLALFGDQAKLCHFAELIVEHLPGENDPDLFGDQIIVDREGEPVALEEALLIGATDLTVGQLVEQIHRLGGLAIASHVDRESFSILGQLGFVPDDLELDGVELSGRAGDKGDYPLGSLPVVRCSDAHFPEEIGQSFTSFLMEDATAAEIGLALGGKDGRRILTDRFKAS
jgi:hypothetical protein